MTVSEPEELRIRNQRYRPWGTLLGATMVACPLVMLALMLLYPRLNTETTSRGVLIWMLGLGAYCGYVWLCFLDLGREPRPGFRTTARAVWRWAVLGVRGAELGPLPAETIALAALGWALPTRISVSHLKLGDGVEIDPKIRFPAGAVRQVRFAPDPAEDYVELDRPAYLCQATMELDSGKQFRLILDAADADALRRWAVGKGIAVSDGDGYQPPPIEPPNAAGQPVEARAQE